MTDVYQQLNEAAFCPTMTFFGLTHVKSDAETTHFTVTFPQAALNPMGYVQGGMISAALDDATSIAMIKGYDRKKSPPINEPSYPVSSPDAGRVGSH